MINKLRQMSDNINSPLGELGDDTKWYLMLNNGYEIDKSLYPLSAEQFNLDSRNVEWPMRDEMKSLINEYQGYVHSIGYREGSGMREIDTNWGYEFVDYIYENIIK